LDGYAKLDNIEVWNLNDQFEPLLIYLCLPFHSKDPKQKERSNLLAQIQWTLLEQPVPALCSSQWRNLLVKLLRKVRELCPV
jgi:MarR-like DNA-binding transcriptional regulator SgrR of sgrS sRNA